MAQGKGAGKGSGRSGGRSASEVAALALEPNGSVAEFTLRAAIAGIVFGMLFGAANAYLGLRVGLTVATSIPIAVLTVAFFRAINSRVTILEANMSQTMGSASSSLAAGTIFTIPALFLWGIVPPIWQIAGLAFLGAILGITAMIPLRRLLIVRAADELPYPEGTACAEVLRATAAESSSGRWIFIGLGVAIAIKLMVGALVLIEPDLSAALPLLPKAELAFEIAPALLAVGYILGYRQSAIMVAGSLISALVLTPLMAVVGQGLSSPLFPELTTPISEMSAGQIWSRYVRYIGAGAVAAAGIVTVLRALPTMAESLAAVVRGLRKGDGGEAEPERKDRDVPGWVVLVGPALVILGLTLIPGLLAGDMSITQRLAAAIGVGIFGVLFVVVSARIVGLIGVSSNPTSGMTLVTLLGVAAVFVLFGWVDNSARAAILTVGTVVCIAASKAGDISQDLKTGYLVGATPARQQIGQLIAACFACWAVAGTVYLLGTTIGFGTPELPAPQATLMKTVIEGVLSGSLPWGLVGTGAAFSLSAMIAGLPGLAFAVGIYLPLGSLTPIFLGGLIRAYVEKRRASAQAGKSESDGDRGILAASGLIAGEGLAGVAIAFVVALRTRVEPGGGIDNFLSQIHFAQKGFAHLHGALAVVVGIALVAGITWLLIRAAGDSEAAAKT
jgi:putative OPT family oligopeptide transporter